MLHLQISNVLFIFVPILLHLHSCRGDIGRFLKQFLYLDFFCETIITYKLSQVIFDALVLKALKLHILDTLIFG